MTGQVTGAPIRVAIVDDQSLIRVGLRMVIDSEHDLVVAAEAADGNEAIALIDQSPVDVMLMDVRMPGLDGIAATRAIVARPNAPRVIVLTTFDLDEYAFAAIRAGASGFLLKDARPAELTAAIRSVHGGDASLAPRVTRRMLELFSAAVPDAGEPAQGEGAQHPSPAASIAALTPREVEVLAAVAEGLSNAEIAGRFYLSESTVKTHIGRVLAKLELRDRVHAVIFAYENGLSRR